ncbi:accessory factor associated with RNA polymerase II [Taxawa tesnikishii (nom. ined.)]|nr:accessory factor associated with RNA polymerase II [Dothideales sp. JES 119]
MATNGAPSPDPLLLLRASISTNTPVIPTTSADASNSSDVSDLAQATHLLFNSQDAAHGASHTSLPVTTPTRFISQAAGSKPLDLFSVYFCWTNRDKAVGEYISATQTLNSQRTQNGASSVVNLVFAEKLDLVTWLAGDVEEAQGAADVARGADGDVVMADAGDGGAREAERLKEIYAGERNMGDRNTVLRGIKPTVRLLPRTQVRRNHTPAHLDPALGSHPAVPTSSAGLRGKTPTGRRPEPIILLSPSASSLLRLSNIKSFLVDGIYTPPTSAASGLNILHVNRTIQSIEPSRPMRFILVESPDNFKPDYWSRVVAVFTTGQAWQFKGYKWQQPAELFNHALGVYVGWRGDAARERQGLGEGRVERKCG